MEPSGRLLVVDALVDNKNPIGLVPVLDISMLVVTEGGRERTLKEFEKLFSEAGLKLTGMTSAPGPFSMIEARMASL